MRDERSDLAAGRLAVVLVAVVGVAGVVGYGVTQSRARTDARAAAERAEATPTQPIALADLTARARSARLSFDVVELARLERELGAAIEASTVYPKTVAARLELVDLLATRALEAVVRGSLLAQERGAAESTIDHAERAARSIVSILREDGADPGRLRAASARLDFARGDALAQAHPVVLLPTYRDAELRLVALSQPLWRRDEAMSSVALDELIAVLQDEPQRTGLQNVLLAVALHERGRRDDALLVLDQVLAEVPTQPTARGLRALWTGPVAVAMPPPGDDAGEPLDDAGVVVEPEPQTEPEPVEPPPVVEPEPEPEPARPPAKTPPSEPRPPKPSPSRGFDDLVAEGCKLARGSDAAKGLELLQRAHDMQPGGAKVTLCMAEAHRALGRAPSARALCDRVLRSSPNHKGANLLAAELADEEGKTSVAVSHYRKVLAADPDHAAAKAYVDAHGG